MIIGFSGLAGAGKTEAASIAALELGPGARRISFAGPLKRMFEALALESPADPEAERAWREAPHPLLCGRTPRQALQTLGTEWGRDCIGADVWVRLWAREAERWPHVVADDVRFENEAAAIRQAGGIVVRVERPGTGSASGSAHLSEQGVVAPDLTVLNDGDLDALDERVSALVRRAARTAAWASPACSARLRAAPRGW